MKNKKDAQKTVRKRKTWTIQPEDDVRIEVERLIGTERGALTDLINKSVRATLAGVGAAEIDRAIAELQKAKARLNKPEGTD